MQTLTEIRSLLVSRGVRPKHRHGQNFLHDHNQLRKLIGAAGVQPGDVVLEVGPGTGTLTEELLEAGARVVACEIDPDMAAIVAARVALRAEWRDRFTLVVGDCLAGKHALNPEVVRALHAARGGEAGGSAARFTLVANLPYGIASPLMVNLLVAHRECRAQFVTIQKEVAERLTASAGGKSYGPLSIVVQLLSRVEMIGVVPAGCFWPEPEVLSAMVAIVRDEGGGAEIEQRRAMARFVTELFSKRRKQLGAIFGRGLEWETMASRGITPDQRPEALSPGQIVSLWRFVEGFAAAEPQNRSGTD